MFDDVRLPEEVEQGATGGPRFQTSITVLATGAEQRNSDWERQRARWELSYGIQNKTDFMDVVKFFYARKGKARGFRFKDWTDYQGTDEAIGTGDGVATTFQLRKNYTSLVTFQRKITRPVTGTVVVKKNGVTQSVTVNYSTGVVTFGVAPASMDAITATFEFDVPVRFDTDELNLEVQTFDAAAIKSLPIVELRE